MTITLSPETEQLIQKSIESGRYTNPDEVIRAASSSLELHESLSACTPGELDALIAEGEADIQRGDVLDGEQALRERQRRRSQNAGNAR